MIQANYRTGLGRGHIRKLQEVQIMHSLSNLISTSFFTIKPLNSYNFEDNIMQNSIMVLRV